jgi:hypothetical protein
MVDAILQGNYQDWRGLCPQPTWEEFAAALGATAVQGPKERTRIATRYGVFAIERAAQPTSIDAWSPIGTDRITIAEINDPVCRDIEDVLNQMGKSESVLEDQRLSPDYVVSEFVFAQRGIVLSVGRPLPATVPHARKLLHVRLFAPVTLQQYLVAIGEPEPSLPTAHP